MENSGGQEIRMGFWLIEMRFACLLVLDILRFLCDDYTALRMLMLTRDDIG